MRCWDIHVVLRICCGGTGITHTGDAGGGNRVVEKANTAKQWTWRGVSIVNGRHALCAMRARDAVLTLEHPWPAQAASSCNSGLCYNFSSNWQAVLLGLQGRHCWQV